MPTKKSTKKAAPKEPAAKVFCPVCPDWEIKHPDRCSNTLKRGRATLYFCCKNCKARYEKNPAKFAKA